MRRLFHGLLFLYVVVFCSYAYLAFFIPDPNQIGVKPLYWYFLTVGSALGLAAWKPTLALHTAARPLTIWLWIYLCYCIILALYSSQSDVAIQYFIKYGEMAALLGSFLLLITHDNGLRTAQLALVLVVVFGIVMNLIDFVQPTWSDVPGRAAGFYGNPNISGKIMAFSMVASIAVIPRRFRLLYCIVAGIGILLTFSRGSWVLWAVAMIGLASAGYLGFQSRRNSAFVLGGVCAFIVYSLLTGGAVGFFEATGLSSSLNENTMGRLGYGDEEFTDGSTAARTDVVGAYFILFQENPLLGLGFDAPPSAHNMFLSSAVQGGLVGLAVFIGLLFVLWNSTYGLGKVLVVLYAASSVFTHNNLDQPAMIIILAMVAAMGETPKRSRRTLEAGKLFRPIEDHQGAKATS